MYNHMFKALISLKDFLLQIIAKASKHLSLVHTCIHVTWLLDK